LRLEIVRPRDAIVVAIDDPSEHPSIAPAHYSGVDVAAGERRIKRRAPRRDHFIGTKRLVVVVQRPRQSWW